MENVHRFATFFNFSRSATGDADRMEIQKYHLRNGFTDGLMDGLTDVLTDGLTNGLTVGLADGHADGHTD